MIPRLGLVLLYLLVCAGSPAQTLNQDELFAGPHIDKLIGEGKYQDAYEFIKAGIEKNEVTKAYSATFYAGLGTFFIEVGQIKDAAETLKVADAVSSRTGLGNSYTARAMTVLLLAQGDFNGAANWAGKSVRESSYRGARNIEIAYCRSLEALARLRSGDLKRAAKLIGDALKDVPDDNDADPLFASRVLFTACLIESHQARYKEAQEYCRRGLEVVEKKKIDSRDVSLAHLAMAESYFLGGDMAKSREFITKSMDHTSGKLKSTHQDMVSALELLARVDLKEAKPADAQAHAQSAFDMAVTIFGEGAGGTKGPQKTLQEAKKANAKQP